MPVMIAVLVLIAVGVMVLPELEPGTPRLAGWATLIVITIVAVLTLRPRRRQRLR